MKKIILTVILVASIVFLSAQNHRHNTPYKSESSRIIRMDDTIYEETTTIFVQGLSTTHKIDLKALYVIPKHLRKINVRYGNSALIIDDIVRKGISFTRTKLSWFVIWDKTYTKDAISKKFSWKIIVNLCIVYGCVLSFFLIIAFLAEKNFKKLLNELRKINVSSFDKDFWQIFTLMIVGVSSVMAWFLTGIKDVTCDIDVFLGLVIYNSLLVLLFYSLVNILKKVLNKKNTKIVKN